MVKIVCLTFLEVAIIILLTKYFGGWLTFALFALPTLTGLFMLWCRRNSYQAAVTKYESAVKDKDSEESLRVLAQPEYAMAQAEVSLHWMTLFTLLIPGLLTTIYAFRLVIPRPDRTKSHFNCATSICLSALYSRG